jgi:hypothetical protein
VAVQGHGPHTEVLCQFRHRDGVEPVAVAGARGTDPV